MIYLDYSANTPSDPAVLDVFLKTERLYMGNPNSTHPAGQAAREKMSRVTDRIAALLGLKPSEIIYTSGASEPTILPLRECTASRHMDGTHLHGVGTILLWEDLCPHSSSRDGRSTLWILDGRAPLTWSSFGNLCGKTRFWWPSVPWTANWERCSRSVRSEPS